MATQNYIAIGVTQQLPVFTEGPVNPYGLGEILGLLEEDLLHRDYVGIQLRQYLANALYGHTPVKTFAFVDVICGDSELHCWRSRRRPSPSDNRSQSGRRFHFL